MISPLCAECVRDLMDATTFRANWIENNVRQSVMGNDPVRFCQQLLEGRYEQVHVETFEQRLPMWAVTFVDGAYLCAWHCQRTYEK